MKTKILILLLFLLPFFGSSQGWWNAAPTITEPYPVYEDNGGIAAAGDYSVDVPYPTTINANDILIAQLLDADNDAFSTPSGWTLIYEYDLNTNASTAWFWKRATGSETGTETFTSTLNAGSGVYGIMSRYSGCVTSGTPYEGMTGVAVSQTASPLIPALTSSGTYRLAVGFITVEDNITLTGFSTYIEAYQALSTYGGDANLAGSYRQVAASGGIISDGLTLGTAEYTGLLGILLKPIE